MAGLNKVKAYLGKTKLVGHYCQLQHDKTIKNLIYNITSATLQDDLLLYNKLMQISTFYK